MRYRQWKVRAVTVLALLIVALIPLLPLLLSGVYPHTHEELRYAALTEHFRSAIQDGIWYPRWLPNLAGGYGYPTFVFYQPLFFFLASAIAIVSGMSAPVACLAAVGIASFLGAGGVYLLGRMRGCRTFSMIAAALFLVTPYLFVDIYVRGDWSETFAILLTPWPIYFALRVQAHLRERVSVIAAALGLAVSIAAIVMSHPATALAFFGCLLLFMAGLTLDLEFRENRISFVKVTGIAILLGLVISSPYWETVFRMRHYVYFDALTADYYSPSNHVVFPKQLISNYWGYGISSFGKHDAMSLQLGGIHFVLALAGLYTARRDLKIQTAFACYAILIFMMLPWSSDAWDHVPLLSMMQFPWRLLSVIGVFQIYVVLGLSSEKQSTRFPTLILAMAFLGILIVNHAQFAVNPRTPAANKWGQLSGTMAAALFEDESLISTYAGANEFLPKTAQMPGEPRGTSLVKVQQGMAIPLNDSTAFKLDYQIDTESPTSAVIRQFYFPGWRVDLDNRTLSAEAMESTLTPSGLMTVAVESPGRHYLRAWYEGPPLSQLRNEFVAVLSVCLTLVLFQITRGKSLLAPG